MEKKIRMGIIGCGRAAENHRISIGECPQACITAVAGGRNAAAFAQTLQVPVMDPVELCHSELVDAVCVLTPPQHHYTYAIEALRAGKHVFVEKPVSFCEEEIRELDREAKKRGLVCMPGHSYIYLPELLRMKRVMDAREIGIPTYAYLGETYYMHPDFLPKYTGPETDVLCHQLYLSLAFLGIPKKMSAFRTEIQAPEGETDGAQVTLMMEYESGTLAHILVSWAAEDDTSDPWTFKIKLLGTGGSTHFSRRDCVIRKNGSCEQYMYQEMFNQVMKWFVKTVENGGGELISTMEDAAWTCRLHGMALEAIQTGKVITVY